MLAFIAELEVKGWRIEQIVSSDAVGWMFHAVAPWGVLHQVWGADDSRTVLYVPINADLTPASNGDYRRFQCGSLPIAPIKPRTFSWKLNA